MAPSQLLQSSWVRIYNYEIEKGLLELFLVSTAMHLMKGAYAILIINNTIVMALAYLLLQKQHPWQILIIALLENLIIYYISRHIGDAQIQQV